MQFIEYGKMAAAFIFSLRLRMIESAMLTSINDDMFAADVIQDPYRYYGQIRDEDPVHWNELYELWVITRHDDLVWPGTTSNFRTLYT